MALKTPYSTVTEANAYLSTNDAWGDLDTSQKNTYLLNGRYFLDSNYSCTDEVDMLDIPDEYKYANALLAEIDLATGLFSVDKTGSNLVVSKKVKAGSVESETVYAGNKGTTPRMGGIDKYPAVTSVLNEYCTLIRNGSGMKNINLLRA